MPTSRNNGLTAVMQREASDLNDVIRGRTASEWRITMALQVMNVPPTYVTASQLEQILNPKPLEKTSMRKNKYVKISVSAQEEHEHVSHQKMNLIRDWHTQINQLKRMFAACPRPRSLSELDNYHSGSPVQNVRNDIRISISNLRVKIRANYSRPAAKYVSMRYKRGLIEAQAVGAFSEISEVRGQLRRFIKEKRERARRLIYEAPIYIERLREYTRTYGGVHLEPGYWIGVMAKLKSREVFCVKKPLNADKHIGIELEFCATADQSKIGVMLSEAGLGKYVHLGSDGSVRPKEGDKAHEIRILAKQEEIGDIVPRVCAVLNKANAYVNKSCGMHVHIDMRTRDVKVSWNNLRRSQALLYKMVPVTRKTGEYCKPVKTLDFQKARYSNSRYLGINCRSLDRYMTIEIRLHSSTIDAKKIVAWVDLLLKVTDGPELKKNIQSLSGLRKSVQVPTDLAEYIKTRVKLFKAQHKGETTEEIEAA